MSRLLRWTVGFLAYFVVACSSAPVATEVPLGTTPAAAGPSQASSPVDSPESDPSRQPDRGDAGHGWRGL
jgi:hypothetical protein